MAAAGRLLRVDIYRKLREEILDCSLKPGSDLREQRLASRFSVSKSPVRDALLRLERESLITIAPRQGYRVAPISLSDAREMFRLRAVLEMASALEAARSATDDGLESLDRFRTFRGGEGSAGFIAYNRDFHCALVRLSGNRRMTAAACDLIEQMNRLVKISVATMRERRSGGLVREHCAIIDALQARDGRRASALLRAHIEAADHRVADGLSRAAVHP